MNRNRLLTSKDIFVILIGSFLSALSCLFASGNGSDNVSTPLSLMVSMIYVLYSIRLPLEQQLLLVAIGIPNTKALGVIGVSCSVMVSTVAVLKYYIFSKNKPVLTIGVSLYLVFCFLSFAKYDDIVSGFVMPIKQAINMVFFITLASYNSISSNAFNTGLKASIALFSGVVFSFGVSVLGASGFSRLAVVGNDSNILAVEVAFVLSYLCVAYTREKAISTLTFSMLVIVLALVSVMCGSRMGLLLFAFIILSTIVFNLGRSGNVIIFSLVFLVAAIAFLRSEFGQDLISAMTLRMEVLENNNDVSNGRFEIWNQYMTALTSSPSRLLFGLGDYTRFGIENQAHNFFIEDLAGYGIIGLLILYPTYIGIYKKQFVAIKKNGCLSRLGLYRFIPIMTPIIGSLTLHGLASIMCTTMIYLGVLALATSKNS